MSDTVGQFICGWILSDTVCPFSPLCFDFIESLATAACLDAAALGCSTLEETEILLTGMLEGFCVK